MASGKGFAKVILFGEHFVVYGLSGLASGIKNLFTEATTKKVDSGIMLIDNIYNRVDNLKEDENFINARVLKPVLDELNIDNIEITLNSSIVPEHGMGYSAALSVSVIRALNNEFNLGLTDEQVNELAYKCETVSHGTPSGIDNTCATYGSLLHFEKNMHGEKNKIEILKLSKPFYLVFGDSGKKGSTKELVAGVRKRKEENPEEYDKVFEEYKKLVSEAEDALLGGDEKKVGELMNRNQELLVKIGVSIPELDKLCKLALENGALGAKLTGAGGGGMMISLVENEEMQTKISQVFKENGFDSIKIKIGE